MTTVLLQTLIEEFHEKMKTFTNGVVRKVNFPNIQDKIMVAIGMRRTGKTHLLLQTIHNLLQEVPITRILYLNFEDDRLSPFSQQQFAKLIDDFYSLYPENHDNLCYLFFDEIQNVEQWHLVIRRYFDTKKVKIYLTGSSAKLLSKEIATSLRGRSIATEVWPFSFLEFLEAKHLLEPSSLESKKNLDQVVGLLNTYLDEGGFPETISLDASDRTRILQDYVSVVIFRDIVERYKITNISLLRYIIKTFIKNSGCGFSVHKLYNDLKSQSFSIGKATIYEYLEYLEDVHLIFSVPLYAESLKKVQANPRKMYVIDTGLAKAYSMSFLQNVGHHFENLVYLDLKRSGHRVFYFLTSNRREVDFLTHDLMGKWHLYQVCWDISDPKTLEREMRALNEAEEELGIKGEIITKDTYFHSFLKNLQ